MIPHRRLFISGEDSDCSDGFCAPPLPPASAHRNLIPRITATAIAVALLLTAIYYAFLLRRRRNRVRSLRLRLPLAAADGDGSINGGAGPGHEDEPVHHVWLIRTVGLDDATIESIGVAVYGDGDKGFGNGVSDCSVCLGEFEDGEAVRLLPKCGHAFHVPCIDTWLRAHVNCPLCRALVVDPGESKDLGAGSVGLAVELPQVWDVAREEEHNGEALDTVVEVRVPEGSDLSQLAADLDGGEECGVLTGEVMIPVESIIDDAAALAVESEETNFVIKNKMKQRDISLSMDSAIEDNEAVVAAEGEESPGDEEDKDKYCSFVEIDFVTKNKVRRANSSSGRRKVHLQAVRSVSSSGRGFFFSRQ